MASGGPLKTLCVLETHAPAQRPLELGEIPATCEIVTGDFWHGEIARLAQAVWAVVARRML